ncbi:hypothetical protein ACFWZ2_42225 [Streptomyces sp. NPDC059002]|uniref:hypothetical protein n=1 Tax=Streptomyces sp. NPDC059002 TaxID=3346690 RepID=UPI00367490DE
MAIDLVLDPPRGVAPVRFGMTLDEAVAAVSGWGQPRVIGPYSHMPSITVSIDLDRVGFQALLERDERVTAVELWWPGEGRVSTTRVLLEGDDVFTTPADEILERAAVRGWTVDASNPERPFIPGVTLAFTRETSQEVPRDRHGLPTYFTSVLVGDENYK